MYTASDLLRDVQREAAQTAIAEVTSIYDRLSGLCESEIERLLLIGFISVSRDVLNLAFFSGEHPDRPNYDCDEYCEGCLKSGDYAGSEIMSVTPQVWIGDYRVDFFMRCLRAYGPRENWKWGSIVVECDGHEFHERTKKQAARDRKRDRVLTGEGYRVFRFTGSEIYRDPYACAYEVYEYAEKGAWL